MGGRRPPPLAASPARAPAAAAIMTREVAWISLPFSLQWQRKRSNRQQQMEMAGGNRRQEPAVSSQASEEAAARAPYNCPELEDLDRELLPEVKVKEQTEEREPLQLHLLLHQVQALLHLLGLRHRRNQRRATRTRCTTGNEYCASSGRAERNR